MRTQQMKVDNTAFLIEKLAADCAPNQFIRELTSNSIQAIEERRRQGWSGNGLVLWDVDWTLVQDRGIYKLQVSDNGTGMTGREIETYINQLACSGRQQGISANFGLGAKITACVTNPAGLTYKSWVGDSGVIATLWRDPASGYGLQQMTLADGTYCHTAPLDDSAKPDPIDSCGTAVVLHGADADQDTFMPPGAVNKWLIKYLNDRYFEFSPHITVRVRNFRKTSRDGWPTSPQQSMGDASGSQLKTIGGMKANLETVKVDSGALKLDGATAHWWLLPEAAVEQRDIWESAAHCAALYQGELYDFLRTRQAASRLRDFGVVFGTHRVVIYVEPDVHALKVYANTSRSALLIDGTPLPWDAWASAFRACMPDPIQRMMDDIVRRTGSRDHREAIRKRLREIDELMKISRYRRTPTGGTRVDGEAKGGEPQPSDSPVPGAPKADRDSKSSRPSPSSAGSLYASYVKASGTPGTAVTTQSDIPMVTWISTSDGSRQPDDLEDRAARYVADSNHIFINRDFRGIQDLMAYCAKTYGRDGGMAQDQQLRDTVEEWVEQQAIEAVMAVKRLEGSPEWNGDDIKTALSEQALTTTLLPRYNLLKTINRALGARLGGQQQSPTEPQKVGVTADA